MQKGGYSEQGQNSIVFDLIAGDTYIFQVLFFPNVYDNIGHLEGELAGNISFDFNGGPAPVPEPTTILLLSTGLAGIIGFKRKKIFKK